MVTVEVTGKLSLESEILNYPKCNFSFFEAIMKEVIKLDSYELQYTILKEKWKKYKEILSI